MGSYISKQDFINLGFNTDIDTTKQKYIYFTLGFLNTSAIMYLIYQYL